MISKLTIPKTFRDAIVLYADPKVRHKLLVAIRFPNGVCCVHRGCVKVKFMETVNRFKCYGCRKQFRRTCLLPENRFVGILLG